MDARGWNDIPVLVPVQDAGEQIVHVRRCADNQENDQEKGLEIEDCRLRK